MTRILLAPVLAVGLLLTGCAPTVTLTPAPQATTVGCAGVVVGLPDTIAGAQRRTTDAQGTAAWGTPVAATLTCGVRVPEVSELRCYTRDGVDWLYDERSLGGSTRGVLTAYGRVPAAQVVVDQREVSVNDVVTALSDPIKAGTKANGRRCVAGDAASPSA